MAAVLAVPAAAVAVGSSGARATSICNHELRRFDGTDVFALSADQVLVMSRALDTTSVRLRKRLPSTTWPRTRPLRLQLAKAAHLGRIYSRAYRADPSDNSLPQEADFENALLDLRRVAHRAHLPACSVKPAAP